MTQNEIITKDDSEADDGFYDIEDENISEEASDEDLETKNKFQRLIKKISQPS